MEKGQKKVALVMSGGGNRAALQVGALKALLDAEIQPDILVAVSAGALNAIHVASYGWGQQQLGELESLWKDAHQRNIYPGNRATMFWRTIRGKSSLVPNHKLYRYLESIIAPGLEFFNDLAIRDTYIVACHLENRAAFVFGDRPDDRILDALMATKAIPPMFPPWKVDNHWLIDGGIASSLPVPVALEHGADEVWGIHVTSLPENRPSPNGVFGNALKAMSSILLQEQEDMASLIRETGGQCLAVTGFERLPYWDFSKGCEMMESGYEQARVQLSSNGHFIGSI